MGKRFSFVLVLLTVLLGRGWGQAPLIYEHTYPAVTVEDARVRTWMDQVDADSLESFITHLTDYHTRAWNSRMVYEVQDWLYEKYVGMGFDTVFLHDFKVPLGDSLYETSDNVIAVQRGTLYPDEYVVCGAHYDSYNKAGGDPDSLRAPGADDNASGVAGVLEIARLLRGHRFERSIVFANWGAEEVGLHGSYAFAHDCAEQRLDIVGYFNLDMIGYLKDGIPMQVLLLYTGRDSLLANYTYSLSNTYFPDMPIQHGWLHAGADSDYSSFNRNGYSAVQTFEHTYFCSPYIHTPQDILGLSVNSMEQEKRFTELNLGLVATLAGLSDASVEDAEEGDLLVYPNPTSGFITLKGLPMREVSVYDLTGQCLLTETCHASTFQLDVVSLATGIYVLRVVDDSMLVHSLRIVKY